MGLEITEYFYLIISFNADYLSSVHAPCPLFLVISVVFLLDVHLHDVILTALSASGYLLAQVLLHLNKQKQF